MHHQSKDTRLALIENFVFQEPSDNIVDQLVYLVGKKIFHEDPGHLAKELDTVLFTKCSEDSTQHEMYQVVFDWALETLKVNYFPNQSNSVH